MRQRLVRILSHRKGSRGYFIQEFEAYFASELKEEIRYEKTFIDHENLKVIIKLPNPVNEQERENIRRKTLNYYTMGIDDLKTRASLIVLEGMNDEAKETLIKKEKELESNEN